MKDEIAIRVLALFAGLFVAAALWILLVWRPEGEARRRVWTVYTVEFGILSAILVPAYLGGAWWVGAAAMLAARGGWEFFRALEQGGEAPYSRTGTLMGIAAVLSVPFWPTWFPHLLLLAIAVAYAGHRWAAGPESPLGRCTSTLVGVLYPGLCLSILVWIGLSEEGFGLLLFVYVLVEINDVAAYLVGSSIGKHKLWPTLSPGKTLEGNLAGVLATLAVTFPLAFAVPELSLGRRLGAGLLIAVAAPAGDLMASWVKRRAGIKDFSSLVPTQGGALDVYDSTVAVSPLFYYFLLATST
ncbi:phosphatidate cytidylyltransferase [Myxococcota bacterium]|nr:phosphatidate cytidylyltransferase [Myxococcota bacterium]